MLTHLPTELVIEIAYKLEPEYILKFLQVNKLNRSLHNSLLFWINYASQSQEIYNESMVALVKAGNITLFKKLWGNKKMLPKVVSDPKMLNDLFETAFRMGHEDLADYCYFLWFSMCSFIYSDDEKIVLLDYIEQLYEHWNALVNNNYINLYYEHVKINKSYQNIIKELLADNVKKAVHLLDEHLKNFGDTLGLERVLAYSQSIHTLDLLINMGLAELDLYFGKPNKLIRIVFIHALKNGNFKLSKQLIDSMGSMLNPVLNFALRNNRNDSLEFIQEIGNNIPSDPDFVGNKNVVYSLLSLIDDSKKSNLILTSFSAFKPYEYIELINKYIKCINSTEKNNLIKILVSNRNLYMAMRVNDEIKTVD